MKITFSVSVHHFQGGVLLNREMAFDPGVFICSFVYLAALCAATAKTLVC